MKKILCIADSNKYFPHCFVTRHAMFCFWLMKVADFLPYQMASTAGEGVFHLRESEQGVVVTESLCTQQW
jgi:hypothetical protein